MTIQATTVGMATNMGFFWMNGHIWAPWGYAMPAFCGSHRSSYTLADAEALAAWLNEREAGYPVHEALMPNTAADQ